MDRLLANLTKFPLFIAEHQAIHHRAVQSFGGIACAFKCADLILEMAILFSHLIDLFIDFIGFLFEISFNLFYF